MLVDNIYVPNSLTLLATHLHSLYTGNEKVKTEFVTDDAQSIQVGVLHRQAGTVVQAHQHLPVQKQVTGTQEVLIVRSGHIVVDIFDTKGNFVAAKPLRTGDIYIQYSGGHAFHFITDVQFVEIKQGPYTPADKVYFNYDFDPTRHEQMK
jgi:hypothetical protein